MTTIILLALIILIIGAFILRGLQKIPVPYVGLITIWGKRKQDEQQKSVYVGEGWHFLPLFPYWYNVILINMERVTFSVIMETAMTPDRTFSKVPITLTYRKNKDRLCEFINSGKDEGVQKQLHGKIEERIREWCMDNEGGPADWIELQKSHLEGTSILAKKIAGNSLKEVPKFAQDIPTWIWLRYYSQPRPTVLLKNEKAWGEKWEKVSEFENTLKTNEVNELKVQVEERRNQIDKLRTGTGTIEVQDLGIIIERLNIGNIDPLGDVALAADKEAKEEQERKAEALEIKYVIERIEQFMNPPCNFSAEQALEAVQTERGKVPKTIQEHKLNISSETRKTIEESLSNMGKQVLEMLTKKIA
jgi:regulator of protease activity HflC (stomatin/prohibitin superfamily)